MGYTAEEVMELLRDRFARSDKSQSHIVMGQVADGTGADQSHWIDAVVFSLWPMNGLTRSAFEIKVSRADFIREINNPLKHKWCLECFDDFWFVGPKEAITLEELPINVGWMETQKNRLVIKRNAVKNPSPRLDKALLASFIRSAKTEVDRATRISEQDVLKSSAAYKTARLYQDGLKLFVAGRVRLDYVDAKTPEDIAEWLNNATMDEQLKADRRQLLEALGHFQREILSLFNAFAVVGNKALLKRDEFGRYIVSSYGGVDQESLEWLKTHLKEKGGYALGREKYAELLELLLNWDKLKPPE